MDKLTDRVKKLQSTAPQNDLGQPLKVPEQVEDFPPKHYPETKEPPPNFPPGNIYPMPDAFYTEILPFCCTPDTLSDLYSFYLGVTRMVISHESANHKEKQCKAIRRFLDVLINMVGSGIPQPYPFTECAESLTSPVKAEIHRTFVEWAQWIDLHFETKHEIFENECPLIAIFQAKLLEFNPARREDNQHQGRN